MSKLAPVETGKKYGRLTVLWEGPRSNPCKGIRRGLRRVHCLCECGRGALVRLANLRKGNTRSCGCLNRELISKRFSKRGKDNHNWKGGRCSDGDGYIRVWTEEGHALEHRLVMSQHLGRQLLPEESVHHINGDRSDNRIENLELWTKSHPSGQRVADKLEWAHELIAKYEG